MYLIRTENMWMKMKRGATAAAAFAVVFGVAAFAPVRALAQDAPAEKPGLHSISTDKSIYVFIDDDSILKAASFNVYRMENAGGHDQTALFEKDTQQSVDNYSTKLEGLQDKVTRELLGGKSAAEVEAEIDALRKTDPAAADKRESELDAMSGQYEALYDKELAELNAEFGRATDTLSQKYCAAPGEGLKIVPTDAPGDSAAPPPSASLPAPGDFTLLNKTPISVKPSADDLMKAMGADAERILSVFSIKDANELLALYEKDPEKLKLAMLVSLNLAEALGRVYIDDSVTPNQSYMYKIEFLDETGKTLATPGVLAAFAQPPILPPPSGFSLTAKNGQVLFNMLQTDGAHGWNLYRSASKTDGFEKINPVLLVSYGESVFGDVPPPSLEPYYYYAVTADLAGNEGKPSEILEAEAATPELLPPANFKTEHKDDKVVLTWEPVKGVAGYDIYESDSIDHAFNKITKEKLSPDVGSYDDPEFIEGAAVYYAITSYDAKGNESVKSPVAWVIPKDETPPAPPTNLTAAVTATSVILKWDAVPADDVHGYMVFRGDAPDNLVKVNNSAIKNSADGYTDTRVMHGRAYYYAVAAVDLMYNKSEYSNIVTVNGPDYHVPSYPASVFASGGDGMITVNWPASHESDLAGYRLYRSSDENGSFTQVGGDISADATQYVDKSSPSNVIANGEKYWYYLTAFDAAGSESVPSHKTFAIPEDESAPASPTGVTVSSDKSGVTISWTPNSEKDIKGYRVLRALAKVAIYKPIDGADTPIAASSVKDSAAQAGQEYWYKVVAVDTSGNESERSDAAGPIGTGAEK